jgi:CheY-like chemotaxis protein
VPDADDKKTILLVDDVAANIQIAREILKDTYKTRVATCGAKALERIKSSPCTGPGSTRRGDA